MAAILPPNPARVNGKQHVKQFSPGSGSGNCGFVRRRAFKTRLMLDSRRGNVGCERKKQSHRALGGFSEKAGGFGCSSVALRFE